MIPTRIGQVCGEYMVVGLQLSRTGAYAVFRGSNALSKRSQLREPSFENRSRLPIAPGIVPRAATIHEHLMIAHFTYGIGKYSRGSFDKCTISELLSNQAWKCGFQFENNKLLNNLRSLSMKLDPNWKLKKSAGAIYSSNSQNENYHLFFCIKIDGKQLWIESTFGYRPTTTFNPIVKVPLL